MEEGPSCVKHGKHLFVYGQDWSFGLFGRVRYDGTTLHKVEAGKIHGTVSVAAGTNLGVDFATASLTDFEKVVREVFMGSRKKLGPLLLDQTHVAGIGVAWGSEVLHACGLNPGIPAKNQDLRPLAAAMCAVRDSALAVYMTKVSDINGWFDNLYAVRVMKVYGIGTAVAISGRTWWQ